ncbi:hypothetical protein [Streptomyces hesseae]|uniref:Aminoglycoside phosphotransferase n=1 Tax=Streptomyces hesseae TaxID=3075519 RepID=A0ABU2SFC8_9ACTN|nr:hypothetical protein [Streptomyces sp. DSM 40473]MDT0447577.1 hypothetical protein [Streptomyces sp. DSM 40473]
MTEPLDRRRMCAALRAAGVNDRLYSVEGVHEPAAPLPDFHFLRLRSGMWETGLFERGEYAVTARFPASEETAACHELLRQLLPGE